MFERLRVFLAYHTRGYDVARALASEYLEQFKGRHLLAYLELVATMAWIEKTHNGCYPETIEQELSLFEKHQCKGKRAALAAQGFLQ
jgi:hypothetical protein